MSLCLYNASSYPAKASAKGILLVTLRPNLYDGRSTN